MTVARVVTPEIYIGLSTDTKPTHIRAGASFYERDTESTYITYDGYNWVVDTKKIKGKPRVSSMPYTYDIAEGNVLGHSSFRILGTNDDVDNVKEDEWAVGGTYVFPTAGMQMEIYSSSVQDSGSGGVNSAGTGIRSVTIVYLDDSWVELTETKILDGTTPVTTVATNIYRIQKMFTATTGTGKKAAGTIDIRHLSDTPIYGRIPLGENHLHQAICTVPLGKTLYITSWQPGIGHQTGNRYARFELDGTADESDIYIDGVFFNKDVIDIQDMAIFIPLPMVQKFPAKTDVKVTVISDNASANALTAVSFEGWIEDA